MIYLRNASIHLVRRYFKTVVFFFLCASDFVVRSLRSLFLLPKQSNRTMYCKRQMYTNRITTLLNHDSRFLAFWLIVDCFFLLFVVCCSFVVGLLVCFLLLFVVLVRLVSPCLVVFSFVFRFCSFPLPF